MNELVSNPQESEDSLASRRRPRLVSSWAALKQIREAFNNKELRVRQRDKLSDVMLTFAIVYAIAIFMFPVQAHPMIKVADVVFGITFFLYVTQRLGILTTLNERQTLLIAELLFCMILIGMYIAINIGAVYIWLKLVAP
jgi:hypothetical protein